MNPGMETRLHRHPGPEAWYTEGGETCLETPEGKQVATKGVSLIVPGGQPMRLFTGTELRRFLVLVNAIPLPLRIGNISRRRSALGNQGR
jgi:quercetin dioxygenase-like cupin family protein